MLSWPIFLGGYVSSPYIINPSLLERKCKGPGPVNNVQNLDFRGPFIKRKVPEHLPFPSWISGARRCYFGFLWGDKKSITTELVGRSLMPWTGWFMMGSLSNALWNSPGIELGTVVFHPHSTNIRMALITAQALGNVIKAATQKKHGWSGNTGATFSEVVNSKNHCFPDKINNFNIL